MLKFDFKDKDSKLHVPPACRRFPKAGAVPLAQQEDLRSTLEKWLERGIITKYILKDRLAHIGDFNFLLHGVEQNGKLRWVANTTKPLNELLHDSCNHLSHIEDIFKFLSSRNFKVFSKIDLTKFYMQGELRNEDSSWRKV